MAIWKRRVTKAADGSGLVVEQERDGANPEGRDDPPEVLTIRPSDKPAVVVYRGDGVSLTAVVMEDHGGASPGFAWHSVGDDVRVEDQGAAGATYRYHLKGRVGDETLQTLEPQTHETPSEPRARKSPAKSPE